MVVKPRLCGPPRLEAHVTTLEALRRGEEGGT